MKRRIICADDHKKRQVPIRRRATPDSLLQQNPAPRIVAWNEPLVGSRVAFGHAHALRMRSGSELRSPESECARGFSWSRGSSTTGLLCGFTVVGSFQGRAAE